MSGQLASGNATTVKPPRLQERAIRVMVADASLIGCELLSNALHRSKKLSVIACTTTVHETTSQLLNAKPDVALVNVHLADGPYSGIRMLQELKGSPKPPIVMMADATNRELILDIFRGGVRGVFCRSQSIQLLYRCIQAVYLGQVWAHSSELRWILEALESAAPLGCFNSNGEPLLTKREQQILPLVADGLTNREISKILNLSEHTIKNYLFRIYDKLGISSRVELILYAVTQRTDAA